MEIGVNVFGGIELERLVELYKNYGIKRTFLSSEKEGFDEAVELLNRNGIICETLHAPFGAINDMWKEGEEGEEMLARLKDAVDKCYKYSIPVAVVHISAKRPMPPMIDIGFDRYDRLVKYAEEKNVKIAFENLRYWDNVEVLMERYKDEGFCWDNGHEACYTPGEHFMPVFGKRLIALHLHDNACDYDKDEHVLPFDGNIDMNEVAKYIADSGYNGTIMLEVTKNASYRGEKIYENLTDDEYMKRASESARKLADMVEAYRK